MNIPNIEVLCHTNQTIMYIEQQLKTLLAQFEIKKSQYSPNDRRLLRQYFVHLTEQCQNHNSTKEIISLTKELADHAYKLPEGMYKRKKNVKLNETQ